jgi:glycosyltransferase involved in cell wall biosynthesis
MIVRDESQKLSRCLSSVKGLASEIIVVDTGSVDNTKEIALSYNAKVFDFKWNNDFSEARNFSIGKSTSDYNLIIDGDEYITSYDMNMLQSFMLEENKIGRVKRIDLFKNNNIIEKENIFITRLVPKGVLYYRSIHEQIFSDLPKVNVSIEIEHDGYLDRDKSKFQRNIDLLKNEIVNVPEEAYNYYQLAKEYSGLKDYNKAKEYLEIGYKIIMPNQSIYPDFIVLYLHIALNNNNFEKGLFIIEQSEKYLIDYPDFYFTCGTFYMNLVLSDINKYIKYLPLIEKSYLKCIQIGETNKYTSIPGTGSYTALYNLGTFYESLGDINNAVHYYTESAKYNYELATNRLKNFK